MATPPKLIEFGCPKCSKSHWEIDRDFRGIGGKKIPYAIRSYTCPHCHFEGEGYTIVQESPPRFMIQPHRMYPMSKEDFAYWFDILKREFPDSWCLNPDSNFVPFTPEEYEKVWPKSEKLVDERYTTMKYTCEDGREISIQMVTEELERSFRTLQSPKNVVVRFKRSPSGSEEVLSNMTYTEALIFYSKFVTE